MEHETEAEGIQGVGRLRCEVTCMGVYGVFDYRGQGFHGVSFMFKMLGYSGYLGTNGKKHR